MSSSKMAQSTSASTSPFRSLSSTVNATRQVLNCPIWLRTHRAYTPCMHTTTQHPVGNVTMWTAGTRLLCYPTPGSNGTSTAAPVILNPGTPPRLLMSANTLFTVQTTNLLRPATRDDASGGLSTAVIVALSVAILLVLLALLAASLAMWWRARRRHAMHEGSKHGSVSAKSSKHPSNRSPSVRMMTSALDMMCNESTYLQHANVIHTSVSTRSLTAASRHRRACLPARWMTCSSVHGRSATKHPRGWCWGRSWAREATARCTKVPRLVVLSQGVCFTFDPF